MLIKIITIVTLIMATVIGVLSFSELSEHSAKRSNSNSKYLSKFVLEGLVSISAISAILIILHKLMF